MLILTIYGVLATAHALILPLTRGEDEYANFRYIQFIAEQGRLPINYQERSQARYKSDWPALYHLTIAQVAGWANDQTPTQIKEINADPRRKLIKDILRPTWILHTEDELPPYRGEILMWYVGRLFTVFLGLGTLSISYFVVLEMFPNRRMMALSVVAFWAVMPRFLFTNAVLSEDSLLGLLMTLWLYLLIKIIKGLDRSWAYLALGGLTGLAVTAKYSAVLVPLEITIIYFYLARRYGWGLLGWLQRLSLTGIAAVVAASWWFGFITWHFNEIHELGLVAGLVKPVLASGIDPSMQQAATFLTAGAVSQEVPTVITYRSLSELTMGFIKSFWSAQAVEQLSNYYHFQPYLHLLITFVALLAPLGWWKIWQANDESDRMWLGVLLLHATMIVPIIGLRFLTQNDPGWAAQGRHLLFPAVPAIGTLLIWGWRAWPSVAGRVRLTPIVIAVLLVWSVTAQIFFPLTIYPIRAPVRTLPEARNQVSHSLNYKFNEAIELIGFETEVRPASTSLEVTLLWQAIGQADEDYLIEVNLLDSAGIVQRQLVRHFGDGLYPSRVWDPGDIVRDNIGLPLAGLPAGEYRVEVQLLGAEGVLKGDEDQTILTTFKIEGTAIQSSFQKLEMEIGPDEVVQGFELWRNGNIAPEKPEYHYRASIPIVWHGSGIEETEINLKLIDPAGRVWLPKRQTGPLTTFIVGPGWRSGDYTLRVEARRNDELVATVDSGPILSIRNEVRLIEVPVMQHRVEANFANRVQLLGYDLLSRQAKAGEGLDLVLYWQGLRTMSQNFVFFTNLVGNDQQLWAKVERWPRDDYPTLLWAPEEIVVDAYEFPLDPTIPEGIYNLEVGLYLPVGEAPILLPVIQKGTISELKSINLGAVKIGDPFEDEVLTPQEIAPQETLLTELGQPPIILLRGYDAIREGDALRLTLYWESLAKTLVDWNTFVHLRNEAGEVVAQGDGPTGHDMYPTSLWESGEVIVDPMTLTVPANLEKGIYSLAIGLYRLDTGQRLELPASEDDSLTLLTVELNNSGGVDE